MNQTTDVNSTLTVASLISDYAVYNEWANKRLVDWLQSKPSSLMKLNVPSSFPGMKGTLVHIWDTERFWLAILQQTKLPVSYRQGFYGTLDEVFSGIVEQSERFSDYVQSLSESALQEDVVFITPWIKGIQPRVNFIHHCLNHSTYHRGQLITIGHAIGLTDAPMTDYCFHLLKG